MCLRRGFATAAMLGTVGLSAPARAQHFEGRASVTLTGAYTQTLTDSAALSLGGPMFALSPSLVALVDSPRTTNTFTYTFALTLPFTPQPPDRHLGLRTASYANRVNYTGHYEINEITTATVGVGLAQSPLNSIDISQNPASAVIQPTPASPATSTMLMLTANEGLSRQFSELFSGTQAFSFAFGDPIDPNTTAILARTFSVSNSLSLSRAFVRDTLVVALTNQVNVFTPGRAPDVSTMLGAVPGTVTPGSVALVDTATLSDSHPFTETLTGTITGGISHTLAPHTIGYSQVQPTANLGLNYTYKLATAGLTLSHAAMPNLTTATLNYTDMASLRVNVPFGLTGWSALGTLGFTHTTPIGTVPTGQGGAPTNVFLGDVDVKYSPPRMETISVGLRTILQRQIIQNEVVGSGGTFTRYTISLNLTYSYPNVHTAQIPPTLNPTPAAPPTPTDIVSSDRFIVNEPPPEPEPEPAQQ